MDRREYMRSYCRDWIARRRRDYFRDKVCAACGSTESLELDHIDPKTKTDHKIWSWSKCRQEKELSKCQVLCSKCHRRKTATENSRRMEGVPIPSKRKITDDEIRLAMAMRSMGASVRAVASVFNMSHNHIAVLTSRSIQATRKI